ncbi:hypothetical protein GIB67_000903 [Kingdonia uniflora]|uniref:Aluminum-activated malate transporter 10 n=1 Tax=Kingdonia uniflora TaxID=39325 RepID=A0A7J7MFV2_9MAGN|nr:hypothetical protein GIB67_000903 [Kingdonia uniflora]
MGNEKNTAGELEWRVRVEDGSSEVLKPEIRWFHRVWLGLVGFFLKLVLRVWKFLKKAWDVAVDDPRKVIHCLKVGLALSVVSLFYYMRPLYQGVGGNAMWAIMTVVVVFEHTVGATLAKCINRGAGTFLAGSLGVGVNWVAGHSREFEPIILGASVFFLASAATFSRFIPSVKQRFDYGAMIFILTFSLVSVSGYRVDKLLDLAQQRLSTIAIGASMCIIITMLVCPIWAGQDLHVLVTRNMDKLANSLDGCVAEYFEDSTSPSDKEEESSKKLQGYKCVLNSKATEESLANFAIWEPAHGRFSFRHPWVQYLKVGAAMRNCGYCIEALNGCIAINSETQAPQFVKNHLSEVCMRLSSHSSNVLKELAQMTKSMKKSTKIDFAIGEMNGAVLDLQDALKSLPTQLTPPPQTNTAVLAPTAVPLIEVAPLVTVASLLIEIASRVEGVFASVDELSRLANFKAVNDKKPKQNQIISRPSVDNQGQETVKALQEV